MLKQSSLHLLKEKRNLLAFSGGADSSALFFLLRENNIVFDIAIIDYGIREQSKEEVHYAQELADRYSLKCHLLTSPLLLKNFESQARAVRYNFFSSLTKEYNYENLLTAHHLGDRFEWMLMQFTKGAGCVELAGMKEHERREDYALIRPLLHLDKSELLKYIREKQIQFFEDETNLNENIKRNSFRHKYSNPLLKKFLGGIKKSFDYIDEDRDELIEDIKVQTIESFAYFKSTDNQRADIFAIDKYLKKKSYMPSSSERELLKNKTVVNLGRRFLINQQHGYVFIMPCVGESLSMPKNFKEECRILKIEPKLRSFLYQNQDVFLKVKDLLA